MKKPNETWVMQSSVGAWRNWEPGGQTWLKMGQVSYFKLRRRDERGKMGQDPILRLPHVADWRSYCGGTGAEQDGMMAERYRKLSAIDAGIHH